MVTHCSQGFEGICNMGVGPFGWRPMIEANPNNRKRLHDIGAKEFEQVMMRWFNAFIPKPNEPIPGVPDYRFTEVKCPTLIVRGGELDYDHPPRTSFEVHALIKGSKLVEPVWPEDAWEVAAGKAGRGEDALFDFWQDGAQQFLDFIDA